MRGDRIDWRALMRACLGGLGMTPDAFWALTPHECALLLGLDAAAPPMARREFESLMARHPDEERSRCDGC